MSTHQQIDIQQLPTKDAHAMLLGMVAPRPIAFVSSIDKKGKPNLSPFSFFNIFSSNPPILVFSPSRRVRDNSEKDTLRNARSVAEVVINLVDESLLERMTLTSFDFPSATNEFDAAGLTPVSSTHVQPPFVGEAKIAMECVVNDIISLGKQGGAGNLVICEVVCIHVQPDLLDNNGRFLQDAFHPIARMGGQTYLTSSGRFDMDKLKRTVLGVHGLPKQIQESPVLTGEQLAKLGKLERYPLSEAFGKLHIAAPATSLAQHQLAAKLIEQNQIEAAMALLCS
jgi:flavin reductase (DIM6/NTAB) family NADH-FMN oxidoreductase RutF